MIARKIKGDRSLVVAMYTHVEGYPPSLNAIQCLSSLFDNIVVVHRNVMKTEWEFPGNVRLSTSREFCHYSQVGKKSFVWKAKSFLQYTWLFYREVKKARPEWVLLHEPVALLSWYVISLLTGIKPKVWYHNHDLFTGKENFFFHWAHKAQFSLFPKLAKFSLPSDDRKQFFPMERLNGSYHFIPNFPGRYLYDRFYTPQSLPSEVRIIYQGFICAGHGLEDILTLMKQEKQSGVLNLRLVLKGYRDEAYLSNFLEKASTEGLRDCVEVHGVTSYSKVPEVVSTCHIGIGIHTKTDTTNKTLGTASNKIYEYAAVGLPVILYDNEQFRKYLSDCKWAFFTDCTTENLRLIVHSIVKNYGEYSAAARADFETKRNFENYFSPAMRDM